MKRTDTTLTVGTIAVVLFAVAALAATGTFDEFAARAWARHHNELVHKAPLHTAVLFLRLQSADLVLDTRMNEEVRP